MYQIDIKYISKFGDKRGIIVKLNTIKNESTAEIVVKKSKFIANTFQVNSKEEAEEKINEIRKKYYDAKHNCYGYIVENIEKSSDDGEPSKTAGAPILELLKKKNLQNVLVIVTRYFGGILLGTGRLVRAYSQVAQEALEISGVTTKIKGEKYTIFINYEDQKDVLYWCKKMNIKVIETNYNNDVKLQLESTKESRENLFNNIKKIKNYIINEDNIYIEN